MKLGAKALVGFFSLLVAGASGCDLDLDPDSLVRELRVLAVRTGEETPGSPSDAQAEIKFGPMGPDLVFTQKELPLRVYTAAPSGPGRRLASTPPLVYDWFVCTGPAALFSPGTLDRDCRKFAPADPPPRQNPALTPLVDAPIRDALLRLPTDKLKEVVGKFLEVAFSAGTGGGRGDMGGGGFMLPTKPLVLLVPVLVQVYYEGTDPKVSLNSEIAYTFVRIIVALPGMTLPEPNHNPMLARLEGGPAVDGPRQWLSPCPDQGPCLRGTLSRSQLYYFRGKTRPGSAEVYTPIDDTERTNVTETLRYAWFATDGAYSDARTGEAAPQTRWDNNDSRPAPPEVQVVSIFLSVQDERGGVDFARYDFDLTP